MNNTIKVIFLGVILLAASCRKNEDSITHIPKEALSVVGINVNSLYKKIDLQALQQMGFIDNLMQRIALKQDSTASIDITATGIDLLNTFYVFALPNFDLPTPSVYYALIPLKNEREFSTFLQKQFVDLNSETLNGIKYVLPNTTTAIGWNNNYAVIAFAGLDVMDYKGDNNPLALAIPAALKKGIEQSLTLKSDASIQQNKQFLALAQQGEDISIWVNYNQTLNSLSQDDLGVAGSLLASQQRLMKDAAFAATINFDKGKITGKTTYHFNESMQGLLKSLAPKNVNHKLYDNVYGSQLNLGMTFNFNPDGIFTVADSMHTLPLALEALRQVGLSTNDITSALTGNVLFAITDFSVKTESQNYSLGGSTYNYTQPVPDFNLYVALGINNFTSFQKIIDLLIQQQVIAPTNQANTYAIDNIALLSFNQETVVISNKEQALMAYFSGKENSPEKPKVLEGKPFSLYVELEKTLQPIPLDLLYGKEDSSVFVRGKKLLKNITAYGGETNGQKSEFQMDINFQNSSKNSLMQLLELVNSIMVSERENINNIDEVFPADDTSSTGDFGV